MNDILSNTIAGLIVEGVKYTYQTLANLSPRPEQDAPPTLAVPVLSALSVMDRQVPEYLIDRVALFLRSSEARVLFYHYLLAASTDNKKRFDETSLQRCLTSYLYLLAGCDQEQAVQLAELLHPVLEQAALVVNSEQKGEVPSTALPISRPAAASRLAKISEFESLLQSLVPDDLAKIAAFEVSYRSLAYQRFGRVTPPSWTVRRSVPIEEIFVPIVMVNHGYHSETTDLQDLLRDGTRVIVLGDPGAGKSTLTIMACRLLAGEPVNGIRAVPLRIVLRDYAASTRDNRQSFLSFLEREISASFQLTPADNALEYLLSSGRAVVFFDGMDELVDEHSRTELAEQIGSFAARYTHARIIVTSRYVGYDQAPLPHDIFESLTLAGFSETATQEYAEKWFALQGRDETSNSAPSALARAFMADSDGLQDLRSNPLLLALLCAIYRGEGYLPRNRVDVYQRCATILFDRWDRERNIVFPVPFRSHLRYVIGHLAAWIFESSERQQGVSEKLLIQETTRYLLGRVFTSEEEVEAEDASTKLVEFCKGRAWVLTEVGDGIYGFTHRTFLEYFAAAHIVRTTRDPRDIWIRVFRSNVRNAAWDMIGQLVFAMSDERDAQATGELVEFICDDIDSYAIGSVELIQWYLRCLQGVALQPASIARTATSIAILLTKVNLGAKKNREIDLSAVVGLRAIAGENKVALARELGSQFRLLGSTTSGPSQQSVLLSIHSRHLLSPLVAQQTSSGDRDRRWDTLKPYAAGEQLRLATFDVEIARSMVQAQELPAKYMVRTYGIRSLFEEGYRYRLRQYQNGKKSVAQGWLDTYIHGTNESPNVFIPNFDDFVEAIVEISLRWREHDGSESLRTGEVELSPDSEFFSQLKSDERLRPFESRFAIWFTFTVISELTGRSNPLRAGWVAAEFKELDADASSLLARDPKDEEGQTGEPTRQALRELVWTCATQRRALCGILGLKFKRT